MSKLPVHNPYSIYQAGDGRHYKIHMSMVQQIVASAVGAQVKNKFSSISETLSPTGWFGGMTKFQSVDFDGKGARSQFEGMMRGRYDEFWRDFQGSGPAAVNKLCQMRRHAQLHADALAKKFQSVANVNGDSLKYLDNQVTVARAVRDGGFAVVAAIATGGVSSGIMSMGTGGYIIAGGATVKMGAKFWDMHTEGTLGSNVNSGLVIVDFASDLMFGCIGVSQAGAKTAAMTTKQAFLFLCATKAPLEMAKSAAGGGSLAQIALAGGFEMAGPLFDLFKGAMADKLIPGVTKVMMTQAHIDGALSVAKDLLSANLAAKTIVGGASLLESVLSFFAMFNMSDEEFIKRYVVVPA